LLGSLLFCPAASDVSGKENIVPLRESGMPFFEFFIFL
jgi:hypothetical protein